MMMNLVGIKLLAEVPYSLLFTYFFLNTGSNLTEFVDLVDIQSEKKVIFSDPAGTKANISGRNCNLLGLIKVL